MTDIVERLRELYRFAAQQKSRDWDEQDEIRDLFKYTFNAAYEAADEIERLREALWQCVHVLQSEIEYCKDHTTAWFKLCVATREKALAALGEKE